MFEISSRPRPLMHCPKEKLCRARPRKAAKRKGSLTNGWGSKFGSPVKPIASDRNDAPIKMRAIIAEVRVAPIKLAEKLSQLSERCANASNNAPTTPTAAASVAVAQPKYIEPITVVTNAICAPRASSTDAR